MNTIPTKINKEDFEVNILPYLSIAKRGFVSKIPLYLIFNGILYVLYTGCQWKSLPTKEFMDEENDIELTHQAYAHHFRKWAKDDSLRALFMASIIAISMYIDLSEINLDGTHTIAKKGGEAVDYQNRKKAKTSNIFPATDRNGNVIAFMPVLPGNHNDCYNLEARFKELVEAIKYIAIFLDADQTIEGAYLNGDPGFDVKSIRKVCFNNGIIPNIKENPRGRKSIKKGRKRLFDEEIYKNRFVCERTYAWNDKFRGVLIRFDKKEIYWTAKNLLVFTLTNLRWIIKDVA